MANEKQDLRTLARLKYQRSNRKKTVKQIADELGVKVPTVKSWKMRDDWDSKEVAKEKKPRGAPKGSKNAIGNRSTGGAKKGEKRALKTGEYEKIMYSTFSPDERTLANLTSRMSKFDLLARHIGILSVREKRMLDRISEAKKKVANGMIPLGAKVGMHPNGSISEAESESEFLFIARLEDALTRVQQKKQDAINALHRFEIEEAEKDDGLLSGETADKTIKMWMQVSAPKADEVEQLFLGGDENADQEPQ